MPAYRIYSLEVTDHVKAPPAIVRCADDHEAMRQARHHLNGKPIEVWLNDKRIGRLEPEKGG